MPRDSVQRTFLVAAILCIVCSVIVSAAAVGLKPRQEANKTLFQRKNILEVVGLKDPNESISAQEVDKQFESIETVIVDLESGEPVVADKIDPKTYDAKKAAKDPDRSVGIPSKKDIAGIKRREMYSKVYIVKEGGQLKYVVLPIYGKGLWSTLYGFIALESNLETVKGITFYQHGETPGLGGEVDNPKWKAKWSGKELFGKDGEIQIHVIKGTVQPTDSKAPYQVDGLSGATITSRGVSNLVRYWVSDAFGPYLEKLKSETGGSNG